MFYEPNVAVNGVRVEPHTLLRAKERGTDEEEIKDVVNTGEAIPGKHGRLGKTKVYPFDQERLGKHYHQKKVEVYYALEKDGAVTITAYVFYGKWEGANASTL